MKIIKQDIKNISLDYFGEVTFPCVDCEKHILEPKEHFRFLTYISYLYNNILILEFGTCHGFSCLSLSQNLSNTIFTYDVTFHDINYIIEKNSNVIFKQMNALYENNVILSKAKIIFLDIDPHDGSQEIQFYNKLLTSNFSGILICDDIILNPGMVNFWNSIKKEKYDLTDVGHWSGTGLVNFSDEKIEIID
jgi:predicted O-methyltransferase YrrM